MTSEHATGIVDNSTHYASPTDRILLTTCRLYAVHKDPYRLYDAIAVEASSLVHAEKCSLMLPAGQRDVLRVRAVKGTDTQRLQYATVKAGDRIAGKVYESGEPLLIDGEKDILRHIVSLRPGYRTASVLCLPLKLDSEVLGVLNLTDKLSGGSFTSGDLALLSLFAFHASLVLKLCSCNKVSEEMRELSVTDFLTGLLNRRYFNVRIEEEYQRLLRGGEGFSLALLDIDNFKMFNDSEGHSAGDLMLKNIAAVLKMTIRAQDILVRYGGEEFAIIMPETSATEAFRVAERLRTAIRQIATSGWKKYPKKRVTVSLGVTACCRPARSVEHFIDMADRALYTAKLSGKDCTVIVDDAESARRGA